MPNRSAILLKRGLLLFWAVWLSVVLATNLCDAAKALGLLREPWPFASGNYGFLVKTTARYDPPAWLNGLLFLGVLCWEATASPAVLGSRRDLSGERQRKAPGCFYAAFAASLSLWAAFAVADEVCITYDVEATHLRLFTAQLATLLAIELLPEETS